MLFKNPWFLLGLVGVLLPVILHLIRSQVAQSYSWGAMRFVSENLAVRRQRMEWEDVLLMLTRCLLIALVTLALARPFVPPDAAVPWLIILPMVLLGLAIFGGSFVISASRSKWVLRFFALMMVLAAAFFLWQERRFNLERFQFSARRDVALVIDGSTSMFLRKDGMTAFERAIQEARDFVREAPRGTAFTVLLGAGSAELMTGSPLSHRADVFEILDGLEAGGGVFRAYDALGLATLSLAEGRGEQKDIVVFSDLQRDGWRLEDGESWRRLGEALAGLPSGEKARLLVRSFLPEENFRNVSVVGIELSREYVGTDREVLIRVKVENTGSEVVTPELVRVMVGEEWLEGRGMGQMVPGESAVVEFRHRFSEVGPLVIKAFVEGNDDLSEDDTFERAVWVREVLPVLVVEGNPSAPFSERAGGYVGLALAPAIEGEKRAVDLRVINAAALGREKLEKEAVVILADVARLPERVAVKLANFLAQGGGVWVIAGSKVIPDFYGRWEGPNGSVMPLKLGEMRFPENGVRAVVGSFDQSVFPLLRGGNGEDLSDAVVTGYRASSALAEWAFTAARYENGEVFLAAGDYEAGRVMVTTTALDARFGGFPARVSFVPLVHELIYWLSGGGGIDLNLGGSWSPSLMIPGDGVSEGDDEEEGLILGEASARGPQGEERVVKAILRKRGTELVVNGSAIPGEYLVQVPEGLEGDVSGEKELPLVVLREGAESRIDGWNEDDRDFIRREVDLVELNSGEEMLAALKGEGFGREIWGVLAGASLVVFFLEGLLARWVSRSRKVEGRMKPDYEGDERFSGSLLKRDHQGKGRAL